MTKKVKFLQDFQGRETREVFYKQGEVVELGDATADLLLKYGRVELVKDAPHYGGQTDPELKPRDDEVIYKEVQADNAVKPVYHDNEPQFENAAEPPKPAARKRGKK